MYIGRDLDADGLHFLVNEIMSLAVRPEGLNECSVLRVELEESGAIIIEDNGRGIPVQRVQIDNSVVRYGIEHVLLWIFKNHADRHYHEELGFLDYLGAVMCALSTRLDVETVWDGKLYRLVGSQGELVEPLKMVGETDRRGTRIWFLPDPEAFGNARFDKERLKNSIQKLAVDYPQVAFVFDI
jgi:DNA gyrase subunit B